MELKIYSKQGEPKLTAAPDDNGSASCGIQEESVLALSFTAFACVAVEVYDYVDFEGVRYWALERYRPRMNARKEWAYSVKFYGAESLGKQALMVNPTDGLDDPIVTLTAPAREHAALIVANLNRDHRHDRLEGRRGDRHALHHHRIHGQIRLRCAERTGLGGRNGVVVRRTDAQHRQV